MPDREPITDVGPSYHAGVDLLLTLEAQHSITGERLQHLLLAMILLELRRLNPNYDLPHSGR